MSVALPTFGAPATTTVFVGRCGADMDEKQARARVQLSGYEQPKYVIKMPRLRGINQQRPDTTYAALPPENARDEIN